MNNEKECNITGVEISRASRSDMPQILSLQHLAYRSEAEIYNDYTIQPLTQTLEEAFFEFDKSIVLKAVLENCIAGSVRVNKNSDSCGEYVYIGKLMVHPDFQNCGIGKALLKEAEKVLDSERYELVTGGKSKKNIELYRKCGYEIYRTEEISPGLNFVYMKKNSKESKYAENI